MSSEQKIKATKVRSAIAEQLKDHGVTTESLRVIMTEDQDGKKVFKLGHVGNGIDVGDHSQEYDHARSYNRVMDKKNDSLFKVEVDGKIYDVRSGTTSPAYDALYEDCRANNLILPDSKQASEEYKDDWTYTMLTGEPLTADGRVRLRDVADAGVGRNVYRPDDDVRALRVRPVVDIE
jgi:hypothetical protein